MLNVVLLVVCICIVLVLLIYLFYWNRLLGYLFGLVFRLCFWNQNESSVWLDIGSIHFSILGGRILLKDLRYHSSNQTIRVVKGQVSWRYWIRAPAEEDDLVHAQVIGETSTLKARSPPSCRVHVKIQGLEWFIYNRTAAYDAIISAMDPSVTQMPESTRPSGDGRSSLRKIFSGASVAPESSLFGRPVSLMSFYDRTPNFIKRAAAWVASQLPNFDAKDLLPFSIEVITAAITLGNPSTPSLLVAEFRRAQGVFGTVPARSRHDLYRQMLSFTFENASLRLAENKRHTDTMSAKGQELHESIRTSDTLTLRQSSYVSFVFFQKLWRKLRLWEVLSPKSKFRLFNAHDGSWRRHKPRKLADDETPVTEYAKARKVLETPLLELSYYVDMPGVVPMRTNAPTTADPLDIGNGGSAPEWGLDLAIIGGTIRYGPWTDRQRVHLQHVFFPQTCSTAEPEPRLKPGDTRKWAALRVFIEMREGVVLQVPFREPSKNWQWDGKTKMPDRSRLREAASIHVKAGDSSTISYTVPFVAGPAGYEPILEVHLDTITVTSSLNDIRLVTGESCRLRAQMPVPLAWNGERTWKYTVSLRSPVLYLLRDHVNMFTDLGKDWGSGPPTDYSRFVPMQYEIEIDMQNYELNTYVNDHNIIDKPLIREENSLLTLRGAQLRNGVKIPFIRYRPIDTTVTFWVDAPALDVYMTLPRWNSHSLFPSPHRSNIGRIGHFYLDSSFRYYADVLPENIDHLKLSIEARGVVYKACGYTIRHFMILRENYFGAFTHFSTLEEYLQKRERGQPVGDPIQLQYREGSSNTMSVQLDVTVDSSAMIVPAGLPGYESYNVKETHNLDNIDMGACAVLVMPSLQLHLRTHDYFMEMALNIDTVVGRAVQHCSEKLFSSPNSYLQGGETLAIDGISVTANRLFGPQPFTATYLCLWEVHIISMNALVSVAEARILQAAGDAFGLHYIDPLNSPAAEYAVPTDPDVTFLKFCLDSANIIWNAGGGAIEFTLPEGLRVDSNDFSGKTYGKVTSIRIPQVALKMLLAAPSSNSVWYEAMSMNADLNIDLYWAPPGWKEKAEQQTAFIARQDSHTLRASFMYLAENTVDHDLLISGRGILDNELYLPQLRIPTRSGSSRRYQFNHSIPAMSPVSQLQSDSEDDANRPELDYDTQLANSRPYRPFVMREDNDSISIGDESDDDGLTDYSTDSEDIRSLDDQYDSWPLLADYTYWTARYTSHCLEKPTLWAQSPYMLHRDCTFRPRPSVPKRTLSLGRTAMVNEKPSQTTKDITVIRLASDQGVSVWITPLVVPASEYLTKDITAHQLSPELRFDALMTRHVKSFSLTTEKSRKSTVFDVTLPSLHVSLAQAVSSTESNGRTGDAPRNDVLSSLMLEVQGIRSKGQLHTGLSIPSDASFTTSFLLANVKLLDREASLSSRDASHAACSIKADACSLNMLDHKLTLDLGRIGMEIEHSAPELLLASASSVAKCAERVINSFKGRSDLELYRQIIFEVINFSRERAIIDPFSTIQPSFLIQSGRPHDIRTDGAFRFLIYLRNCLRYLEPDERYAVLTIQRSDSPQVSVEELQATIQAQMAHSDIDFQDATHKQHSILHDLVPDLDTLGGPVALTELQEQRGPLEKIDFQLKQLRLSISHPDDTSYSEAYLRRVVLSVSTRAAIVSQAASIPKQSTTSLREGESPNIRQVALIITTGDVGVNVSPQLLSFLQVAIRVKRHYASTFSPLPAKSRLSPSPSVSPRILPALYEVNVIVSSRSLRFKAAAERLVIEYKASEVAYTSNALAKYVSNSRTSWDLSTNHTLTFAEVRLQACSVGEMTKSKDYTVLASLAVTGGRVSTSLRYEPHARPNVRSVFLMQCIHLNVPRSAMRLYRFMEEWQADYLPGLHATTKALLSELDTGRGKPRSISSRTSNHTMLPTLDLHTSVASLRVSLQVMHGTWLSWEICHTVAYLSAINAARKRTYRFGVQVGTQCFSISSRTAQDNKPGIRVKLELPTFTMTGNHDGRIIRSTALIEFFHLTVKPSHWDTLLSVQQKFGQDFHDLMTLIADTRQKKNVITHTNEALETKATLEYAVSFKMQGFRVGLEGHASTLFLECEDVHGEIIEERHTKWRITLRDLALSLASNAKLPSHESTFDRGRRSAFVIVDCALTMQSKIPSTTKRVDFELTKMHAVMQPSSIGELGDFVDHLQAEVLVRQGKRAKELDEFKEKTRRVMRTFDVKIGDSQSPEDEFWWDGYILNLQIQNFSIAFPLTLTQELQLPRSGSTDEAAVRAFLFSIKSIVFGTHRGQTGEVTMLGFSFQFVPSFKQSNPKDFSGELHRTYNRLVYPEMKAQLRTERSSDSRRIYLTSDVNGFILDIDSSMPDYVHSLIDVYRQGRERVERLANTIPRSQVVNDVPVSHGGAPSHDEYSTLLTSGVLASLTFASGKVRMHSRDANPYAPRVRSVSMLKRESKESTDGRSRDTAAESFNLPVVSVWCEYRATPAMSKVPGPPLSAQPSSLLFKSTIHSSQNTLRPTLLPFLTEFVGRVEDRMREATSRESHASPVSQDISMAIQEKRTEQMVESVSSMQISLSLRIDQSKLELTCQPDVNVIAGLHWESGGFMLNISPGVRRVILSGSVGGLTAGLKHGFLSEDCVKLNARNLAFSLNFSKPDGKFELSPSSLSLVVDTEFSGGVRFSRLQDVLCFKAVWLDRIPILSGQNSVPLSAVSKTTSHPSVSPALAKQELVTAVVVRLRSIKLDVDLGQSISAVKLHLSDGIVRTKVTESVTTLSLSVAKFSVNATGNLSGHMHVPDFSFQTMRSSEHKSDDSMDGRMLDLSMTSGPLNLELDSEFHKLIHYRAEPLKIMIYDDWSKLSSSIPAAERRVRLAFVVSGTEVIAMMNVGTIPKLVSYATKFKINLEVQKEGASRESKAFRMAVAPRHDNLSAVANAMLVSARSRMKEAGNTFAYAVGQRLSLRVDLLQLIVFPRTMRDHEVAHFVGRDVHARLDRLVESNVSPATRTLHLSFSSMTISKIVQLNHALATMEDAPDCKEWFILLSKGASEATIFGLPSMDMYMKSDESLVDHARTIEYDFKSSFKTRDGKKDPEDIYISLNMSLYSWLTILRKTFAREMDQVQAAAELQRSLTTSLSTGPALQRKRMPEPLSIITEHPGPLKDSPEPLASALPPSSPSTPSREIPPSESQPVTSPTLKSLSPKSAMSLASPAPETPELSASASVSRNSNGAIVYRPRSRHIERLTMRQLGEATPDVMHPFFMKKAGFNLEDSLPQYVHEYAALPTEEIMKALLKLYSRQLKADTPSIPTR